MLLHFCLGTYRSLLRDIAHLEAAPRKLDTFFVLRTEQLFILCHDGLQGSVEVGDLVIWFSHDKTAFVALVVEKVTCHGGGDTGWRRILANVGSGPKKFLVLNRNCEIIR